MNGREREASQTPRVERLRVDELKDDDQVVLYDRNLDLEVDVDGGFIKRLSTVIKKYQREVQLTAIGGTIIAVCVLAKHLRRERK